MLISFVRSEALMFLILMIWYSSVVTISKDFDGQLRLMVLSHSKYSDNVVSVLSERVQPANVTSDGNADVSSDISKA